MARKRLTPAQAMFLGDAGAAISAPPPIAQVAGASAAEAALEAVTAELRAAEDEGRVIRALPLDAIETGYLRRDRLEAEPEALDALKQSLRARGQQTPIEVEALPGADRWGLISGWRRVVALKALADETGEARFETVLALIRRPEDSSDAYVAMVEENEIRAGLSFFERARVVRRAVEAGAFACERDALAALFSTASAPKRSKIKSFIAVVAALDGALAFPTHIPERTGLKLARAIDEDPGFASRLARTLAAAPPGTPEAEAQILAEALAGPGKAAPKPVAQPGIAVTVRRGRVVLEGAGVTEEFAARLAVWLRTL